MKNKKRDAAKHWFFTAQNIREVAILYMRRSGIRNMASILSLKNSAFSQGTVISADILSS
ncbi:hypothetical protein A1OW_07335 [Enterovibrio norvegicus]|nr:hypothetical protein A1OW_07335 [Enterovibrio norvegicus]OEF55716.1 hypothetical protein A1OU_13070 [Enterovibrio norvegicus]